MSVPIVMARVTPAASARRSTSGRWDRSRSSVRWQWESITSEGGVERVLGVPYLRLLAVGPDHRDHVEPARRLRGAVAAEVVPGGLGDLVALEAVDLVLGHRLVLGA